MVYDCTFVAVARDTVNIRSNIKYCLANRKVYMSDDGLDNELR